MKSNNLFHSFLVAALLAGGTSCSEFLDTSLDQNETGESIETTRGTLWKFGNAFYTPLSNGFTALDSNLFAAATDEAQQTRVQSDASYFNKGVLNANLNPLSGNYTDCYEGIRAANFFLDYTSDGKGEKMVGMNRDTINDRPNYLKDLASLHWYQAEAHVARAWYYAELIKQYGGVPIVETPYAAGRFVARSSYEEVVEYIVREIDDCKDRLAVDWSDYSERSGRFTLGAALAVKARVLLYAASPLHNPQNDRTKWERAAAAAWEIISHPDLDYALDGDYGAYFRGNRSLSSPETIYVVRRDQSNSLERNNYPVATPGGGSGVTPTQNLVEAYEYVGDPVPGDPYANRDPRLAASVVTNGSTWNGRVIDQAPGGSDDRSAPNASKTGYYLKKFLTDELNLTQDAKAQHNWVAYRYAEVLLNYAEAMNEAYGPVAAPGDYTLTALDALQLVRDRASLALEPVTTTDRDELRKAIKHERFVELAFEDHRYWDLLRWKDALEVLNRPVRGVEVRKTADGWSYTEITVASRTFLERNYYMPFTRSEVVNSNNTLRQNPGY
ncbi:RagB/SusD family nutrient uptake outer membrane protein [Alistipes sp.]|uniref:RagB/SusD family nutrient uptake outer membrane protein n=1 Tax=Alistipes sp. TaxID=1872444 RepID=UPI003AEF942E